MKKSNIFLDPQAPNTNFLLGAALSGGDPIAAARLLVPEPKESKACKWGGCNGVIVNGKCTKCKQPQ